MELATRSLPHLLIAVCGYAGGGKSTTAHVLARALCPDQPPIVIDTEGLSGLCAPAPGEPADPPNTFDFYVQPMDPPFSPLGFFQALAAAAQHKPGVVIIDTMSYEWTGDGGMIEMADEAAKNMKGNTWAGWNTPRKEQRQFMARLDRFPFHKILCVRSREKTRMKNGQVVSDGYHPQLDDDLVFACQVRLHVRQRTSRGTGGYPSPNDFRAWRIPGELNDKAWASGALAEDKPIGEEFGRLLGEWAGQNGTK